MAEQIGSNSPDGALVQGQVRQVISGEGATRTLLSSESGALCLFDRAAGIVYTLPAPLVGLEFDFLITIEGSGASYSIDTDAATTFIGGGIATVSTSLAEGGESFPATIASDVSCDFDGATAGRLVGTQVKFTCISATEWVCKGVMHGVGTLVTPFA